MPRAELLESRRPSRAAEVETTKGWVCGVVEKGSDWLGSYTGPHTKGSVDEVMTWLATRIRSLMGKAAHLCRV